MEKEIEILTKLVDNISLYDDSKKFRMCMFHNCNKQATYGFEGSKKRLLCKDHKLSEMVDVAHPKCIICKKKRPNFGIEDKKPTHCKNCKEEEMKDVKNKKCLVCKKVQPVFNHPGSTNASHCFTCKLPGMVDVLNKLCPCNEKQRSCNYPGENKPIYCNSCKLPGMVNLYVKMCITCNEVEAKFNNEGEKDGKYCHKCKETDMIDVVNLICKTPLCSTRRNPNQEYEGFCVRCFINIFPDKKISRIYRLKEQHVKDFVELHFKQYKPIYDKRIPGGTSQRRPDILIRFKDFIIIIEIDENSHKSYEKYCEVVRINELFTDLKDLPIIFIRFNPDDYRNESNEKINGCFTYNRTLEMPYVCDKRELELRLDILKQTIEKYIESGVKETTIEYLFYDRNRVKKLNKV